MTDKKLYDDIRGVERNVIYGAGMGDGSEFKVRYSKRIDEWEDTLMGTCKSPEIADEVARRWNAYEAHAAAVERVLEALGDEWQHYKEMGLGGKALAVKQAADIVRREMWGNGP